MGQPPVGGGLVGLSFAFADKRTTVRVVTQALTNAFFQGLSNELVELQAQADGVPFDQIRANEAIFEAFGAAGGYISYALQDYGVGGLSDFQANTSAAAVNALLTSVAEGKSLKDTFASVVVSAGIGGVIGELQLGDEIDPGHTFGLDSEAVRQLVISSISKTLGTVLTPALKSLLFDLRTSPEGAELNEALR